MSILDRLGTVIKSYLGDTEIPWKREEPSHRRDPDFDAAYEELDDFLKGKNGKESRQSEKQASEKRTKPLTDEIRGDFAELGLKPDATAEECKEAFKKLLKIHHPDRHAMHGENLKKATEKTTRINAAYKRLSEWFR